MTGIVNVERCGRVVLVRCLGDLDVARRDHFRAALSRVRPSDPDRQDVGRDADTDALVLDLGEVGFLDCSVVAVIVDLAQELRRVGVQMLLARPVRVVRRLLTVLQLDHEIVIADTTEDALFLATTWAEVERRGTRARTPMHAAPRPRRGGAS